MESTQVAKPMSKKDLKKQQGMYPGYIGELMDDQVIVFRNFKSWIEINHTHILENPWMTDQFLIRFCRARKFELDKITLMFDNYVKYRKDNGIDTIMEKEIVSQEQTNELQKYYGKGYMGVDKIGRPIYIEKTGQINPTKLWTAIDEPTLVRSFMYSYEELVKKNFLACSIVAKKQIFHTFTILDMTGFTMALFGKRTQNLVKLGSQIAQDYYPEQLGQMMIVNAPWIFTGVWAVVKAFLDEKTRKKIQIVGGSYKKELVKYIDKEQLPEFLGGTNKALLTDNWGPWNEFDLVDGYKKGDVVGLRKKSDGPNGPVFTPKEFEALPNYLLQNPDSPQQMFGTFGDPTQSVVDTKEVGALQAKAEQMKFEDEKESEDTESQMTAQINITRPQSFVSEQEGPKGDIGESTESAAYAEPSPQADIKS